MTLSGNQAIWVQRSRSHIYLDEDLKCRVLPTSQVDKEECNIVRYQRQWKKNKRRLIIYEFVYNNDSTMRNNHKETR